MDMIEERVMKLEFCVEKLTELVNEMRQETKARSNRMKDWILGIIAGVLIVFLVSLGTYTMRGIETQIGGNVMQNTTTQEVK